MAETQDQTQAEALVLTKPIELKAAEDQEQVNVSQIYENLVTEYVTQFRKWEDWRRPFESLWTEIYRLYMTTSGAQKLLTRAKVMLPIVFQIVEAAIAKFVTIIFGQPQFFDVISGNPLKPVPEPVLKNIETLLKYQLDKADFFSKFVDFVKQLLLYGTSYFYVYWKVRREWVFERTPIREVQSVGGIVLNDNALRWEKKLEYKVLERRPEVEVLPIEDVYPDPDAANVVDGAGLYIVTHMSMQDLKELSSGKYPMYTNYAEVENMGLGQEETQFKIDKRTIRGTGIVRPSRADKKSVEILTFWGRCDLDGDGIREEAQIVIANRKVLIRAKRNPFEHQERPLIKSTLFPVPMEWYGLGLVEPVIPMVNELVTLRNQNLDMNNLIINRMWKVDSLADVDLDTLISSPNGIIITSPMDGVEPIQQDQIPFSPREMTSMIQADIENATSPKSIQGTGESGVLGRTARGAQLIISQALEKFGMGAKLIEDTGIKKVLQMMHKLNAQFLDNDEVLTNPVFYGDIFPEKPTPEQIRADINFRMLGLSETVTKEAMINQLTAYMNIWKDADWLNLRKISEIMWNLMQFKEDVATVMVEPQAVPPLPAPVSDVLAEGSGAVAPSSTPSDSISNQVAQNGSGGSISAPQ